MKVALPWTLLHFSLIAVINRSNLIVAGVVALYTPHTARSEVRFTLYNGIGIQYCEADVYIRNFVTAQQKCQNWCCAACIDAIFGQQGYAISQRTIVEHNISKSGLLPSYWGADRWRSVRPLGRPIRSRIWSAGIIYSRTLRWDMELWWRNDHSSGTCGQ